MALQSLQPPYTSRPTRMHMLASVLVAMLLMATWGTTVSAQGPATDVAWLKGSEFQSQLRSNISLTWQSRGLREGLESLARTQRVAIFLDRRVDPGRRVTYATDGQSLEAAVRGIAGKARLGVGFVGPVVYVGPPLACARIATLAEVRNEQVKDLPAAAHQRLLRRNETDWADLVEPRLLFTRMATRAGLTAPNVQAIPHDVWQAASFPKLTFSEQATLILSGFDMSFRWHKNARQVYLVKFPNAVSIERAYGSSNPKALAKELQELLPQAFVEVKDKRVAVRSMLEDHWRIERTRGTKGTPEKKTPDPKDERYTLTVKNQPAATLFDLLTKKLDLELVIREGTPQENLEKPISFSVNEATSIEVFKAIGRAAGLGVQFDTGKVYVLRMPGEE